MAIQFSTATRNRFRDAYAAAFPAAAVLTLRTGAPAGANGAAGGTVVATITLPATPLTSGTGQVTLSGTWSDTSADAAGTVGHYRLTNGSDVEEGTVTITGGGGDLTLDNNVLALSQVVSITSWTRTMPGA